MKYTPGTWKVIKPENEGTDLHIIAEYSPEEREKYPYSKGKWIASARCYDINTFEANANLIAAAPDLYEALKRIRNVIGANPSLLTSDELHEALGNMTSAIEKAEGRHRKEG